LVVTKSVHQVITPTAARPGRGRGLLRAPAERGGPRLAMSVFMPRMYQGPPGSSRPARRLHRPAVPAGTPRRGGALSRPDVLVVEDNADGRESLRQLLGLLGLAVEVAADGPEGVAKGLELRPRAAVIDIGLPGLDGLAVARELRRALGGDVLLIAHT